MLDPLLTLFGTGCVYTNSTSVTKPVDSGVLVFIPTVNVLAHLLLLLMFILTVCATAHLVTLTGTPCNTHGYWLCLQKRYTLPFVFILTEQCYNTCW